MNQTNAYSRSGTFIRRQWPKVCRWPLGPALPTWDSYVSTVSVGAATSISVTPTLRQIADLREMAESGILQDEQKYFSISSPRQSPWYNFDPRGYLECAMAGSSGGWDPDDDTGRQYVPGEVAVLAEDGSIQSSNPEDLPNPTFEMPVITWEQFKDFIVCGQIYE
jgi:hypothetical protein